MPDAEPSSPPSYTDEDLQGAVDHAMRYLTTKQVNGSAGDPQLPDAGWAPFEDAVLVDESKQVPDTLVAGFVWRERISVLCSEAKAGKSTALAQVLLASVDGNPFADERVSELGDGQIAVVTEEPLGLLKARLSRYGLDAERHVGRIWLCSPRDGLDRIFAAFARQRPAVILIDSLTAWAVQTPAESMNDPMAMRRLVEAFRPVAEDGAGVGFVHHGRKSDGALRDSGDLAASPDMLISFDPVSPDGVVVSKEKSNLRRLSYIGRWPVGTVTLSFNRSTSTYEIDQTRTAADRAAEQL